MKDLDEFLKRTQYIDFVRPEVICNDGFRISIQASLYHRCTPRQNYLLNYSEFELGFPSEKEDLIFRYAEDQKQPLKTVYSWVNKQIVCDVIQKHGGINFLLTSP